MITDILNTYWDDWRVDRYPKDRRMLVVSDVIGEPSMSTENFRFLLNEMVRRLGGVYLEVGVWVGHSLMSAAIYNDDVECIGIENFTSHPDVERLRNTMTHIPNARLIEGDCRDVIPTMHYDYGGKVSVYYYDGDHSLDGTLWGLQLAKPLMAPNSYMVIDDMIMNQVRHAVERFVRTEYEWNPALYIVPQRTSEITKMKFRPWYNGVAVLKRRPV